MPRYAALLRGVSPMNARMADLARAFAAAGFSDVRTVLSSGNVVFTAARASDAALERRAEGAMREELGRVFPAIVRPIAALRALLDGDPYRGARVPAGAKRVVTFLRRPPASRIELPVVLHGARIVALRGKEAFTAYVRTRGVPDFMTLIERTFGKELTTRTWETVGKVVAAGARVQRFRSLDSRR
jgi:uncharacterized protein (DUF1697 family)